METEVRMLRLSVLIVAALALPALAVQAGTLFVEQFEDGDLASRGWYDNPAVSLSTAEHLPGSASSIEFHFPVGATTPAVGGGHRMLFPPTPTIYLRYYVKYSASYTGSNRPYHPHEFHFVTDLDSRWIGPAWTHLTLYIEQNEGEPMLAIQDGQNIDEANIGVDLTAVTEQRAVAGCNGDGDGHGAGDCYPVGSVHYNGKAWRAGQVLFSDSPGPYDKNAWHLVEAQFDLNSIAFGIGLADGGVRYWFDGVAIIDHRDVMLRTGEHATMQFNQFLIAPYIGDGSPVDQTMWVDDLTVATERSLPLLRNDQIRSLTPLDPPLTDIFTGVDINSLDYEGPDDAADEGEGNREGTHGSEDDDDYYRADFLAGMPDPDIVPVLGDDTRMLVFYQLRAAVNTLRLVEAGGNVLISY